MNAGNGSSHTWLEAFGVGVPGAVCLLAIHDAFIRHALLALAPHRLQACSRAVLAGFEPLRHPIQALRILLAVNLGILSHVFLDSLTHQGTWLSRAIPAAARPCPFDATKLFLAPMTWLDVVQYVLTFAGLALLIFTIMRAFRRPLAIPRSHHPEALSPALRRTMLLLMPASCIACAWARMQVHTANHWHLAPPRGSAAFVITMATAIFVQLLILGIFVRFARLHSNAVPLRTEAVISTDN